MYIMGRENADGKATGVVHKIAEDSSHKLCGSFKIMSDGIITRFTGMSKADWNKHDEICRSRVQSEVRSRANGYTRNSTNKSCCIN